jgi:intracellular multiplication protein IcmB
MFTSLARALAGFSLALKQPLQSFCELETAHGDALVTKAGHYVTLIRVDGMQKMGERKDFARITEAMRLDLSGALEARGHAMVGWYISDPDAALVELNNVNLNSCRSVAREAGLNFDDILDERAHLWPSLMRWEAAYFVVWTQTSVLTKEERKQLKAEYAANVAQVGPLGDTQRFTLRSEIIHFPRPLGAADARRRRVALHAARRPEAGARDDVSRVVRLRLARHSARRQGDAALPRG